MKLIELKKSRRNTILLLIFFIILLLPNLGITSVEWKIKKTLKIEKNPKDIAVSKDGDRIFILTAQGTIYVYSSDGTLHDEISVGKHIDRIKSGPRKNILLITSKQNKTIQVINLEFIQEIDISGSPFKGPADAPIVIVVFSDFQCKYCSKLAPLLDQVFNKYPHKVKLVFKNYPLLNHKFAIKAANAALAANRQGKFWEFHHLLLENYNCLNNDKIQEIVRDLGLDKDMFQKEMIAPHIMAKIKQDLSDGKKAGVKGIPAVFINGKLLKNRTLRGFSKIIDKELDKH